MRRPQEDDAADDGGRGVGDLVADDVQARRQFPAAVILVFAVDVSLSSPEMLSKRSMTLLAFLSGKRAYL